MPDSEAGYRWRYSATRTNMYDGYANATARDSNVIYDRYNSFRRVRGDYREIIFIRRPYEQFERSAYGDE